MRESMRGRKKNIAKERGKEEKERDRRRHIKRKGQIVFILFTLFKKYPSDKIFQ